MIGVPLGLQPVRAVRSRGLAVSLVIILSYYLMLSAAETLGHARARPDHRSRSGRPTSSSASIGVVLFVRQAHELSRDGESWSSRALRGDHAELASRRRSAGRADGRQPSGCRPSRATCCASSPAPSSLCLVAFVGLYLCVDFFERFPGFLSHDAPTSLIVLYFVLKIPLIVTQMMPVAVSSAMLLSLGALARRSELMAMRACGVSLWQIGGPLVGGVAADLAAHARLERVRRARRLAPARTTSSGCRSRTRSSRATSTRRRSGTTARSSFTNIDRFDANRNEIYGLTRYEFDDHVPARRIVEAAARATGPDDAGEPATSRRCASARTARSRPRRSRTPSSRSTRPRRTSRRSTATRRT